MQFINYNANPKNRKTADCVIRALSTALNSSWEDTYRSIVEFSIKRGLMCNDKRAYTDYLKGKGYEMLKMPRHKDNTRYTVKEFIDELAEANTIYIISVANHLTVVKDRVLLDTWNCSRKSVGNYWIVN